MSFDPRLPREGVNVSDNHPLREAVFLLAGVLGAAILLVSAAGLAIDWAVPRLPVGLEVALFAGWVPDPGVPSPTGEVRVELSMPAEAADPRKREASRRFAVAGELVERLTAHWSQNPYSFRVLSLDMKEPNAVALPGGFILVSDGLLEGVASENELAFVLAHEIGHFHNRDHLRGIGRGAVLAVVSAWLGGGQTSTGLMNAVGTVAGRRYDQGQESEADAFAMGLLVAEYGHAAGATGVFERLLADLPSEGGAAAAYLATHPSSELRIEQLRELARREGWSLEAERRALPTVPIPD